MFRKSLVIGAILGMVGASTLTVAQAKESPRQELKVAVVDFQRAINETEDGKKAEKSLNSALAERKKKFEILKNELEALRKDFEKQRLVLSGKSLENKKFELQKKLIEVEQTGVNYEQDLARKKAESLRKILVGLQEVVKNIGKKGKYDFIFEKSQGGVLYSADAEDITTRVIKAYNTHSRKKK